MIIHNINGAFNGQGLTQGLKFFTPQIKMVQNGIKYIGELKSIQQTMR